MNLARIAAAGILVGVAACSGGPSGGAPGGRADAGFPTAASIAAKVGCSDTFQEAAPADRQFFTADEGECTLAGVKVNIETFTTSAARESWLKTARNFGGRFCLFDRALAYGDAASDADTLKAAAGCDVVT